MPARYFSCIISLKCTTPHCAVGIIISAWQTRNTSSRSSTTCWHGMDWKWWAGVSFRLVGTQGLCSWPICTCPLGDWGERAGAHGALTVHLLKALGRLGDSPFAPPVSSASTPGNICSRWSATFSCYHYYRKRCVHSGKWKAIARTKSVVGM